MSSRRPRSLRRKIFGVVSLLLVAAAWFFFAPQRIGGDVTYAVITGRSMEPTLQASDLALVRERAQYGVGDNIAYRSETLGQVVLHRIVDVEDGGFVTQGDNNDFLDSDRPTADDVLGTLWIRVPRGGLVVERLQSPVGLAMLSVGGLGFLGAFSVGRRRKRRSGKHRRSRQSVEEPVSLPVRPASLPVSQERSRGTRNVATIRIAAASIAACALVSGAIAMVAYARPLVRSVPSDIQYVHSGTFDYSAPAPDGPVYQKPSIEAGDPVFTHLIRDLWVEFHYKLDSTADSDVELDGALSAVVRTDNGWTRTIPIAKRQGHGNELTLGGTLDLAALKKVLGRIEKLTGMAPGTYSLSIEPRVDLEGAIGGVPVADTFSSSLPFQLNDIQLGLYRLQSSGRQVSLTELLNPSREENLATKIVVPNPFVVAGQEVSVPAVRRASTAAAGGSLLVLFVLALFWRARRPRDEASRIAARYGSMLIPVTDAPDLSHETVDVSDFDKLVRLAQQFEQPIMHRDYGDGVHSYVLYYDGLAYRYRIGGREETLPAPIYAVLTRPTQPEEDLPEKTGAGPLP